MSSEDSVGDTPQIAPYVGACVFSLGLASPFALLEMWAIAGFLALPVVAIPLFMGAGYLFNRGEFPQ